MAKLSSVHISDKRTFLWNLYCYKKDGSMSVDRIIGTYKQARNEAFDLARFKFAKVDLDGPYET